MSIESEENKNQEVCQERAASETETDSNKEVDVDEQVENEWIDLLGSGVIKKKILKEGTPDTHPQRQQTCVLNYELSVEDDIIEQEENCEIELGDNDVIQGLDVSIGLMNEGEICILKIEPRLAFGKKGLPPKIGSETTITYKVELVSVRDEELETMTIAERKLKGNKKRERGNYWYGRGENSMAVQCYRKALDYLDEVEGGIKLPKSETESVSDSELQDLLENRISVYNNLAAAQIRMESYDAALNSLKTVLKCQPHNIKALFRQAKAYTAKTDITSAIQSLQKAREVSPDDPDILNELSKLKQVVEKQKKTERDLAKRMFGTGNSKHQKKEQKSNKVYLWATIAATVAVGMAGLASYRLKFF